MLGLIGVKSALAPQPWYSPRSALSSVPPNQGLDRKDISPVGLVVIGFYFILLSRINCYACALADNILGFKPNIFGFLFRF